MQSCIENATLPLRETTSLPLFESASQSLVDATPAWKIRIARPASPDRNELAQELRGVPKAALRHVFGKIMGTRLWQLNRAIAAASPVSAKPTPVAAIPRNPPISDRDISSSLLRYLCAEIASTLSDRKRFAKSIVLTAQFSGGETETVRHSLPQPANDSVALETAARLALRRMRSNTFVSLKLDVTATVGPCIASMPDAEPAGSTAHLTAVA